MSVDISLGCWSSDIFMFYFIPPVSWKFSFIPITASVVSESTLVGIFIFLYLNKICETEQQVNEKLMAYGNNCG